MARRLLAFRRYNRIEGAREFLARFVGFEFARLLDEPFRLRCFLLAQSVHSDLPISRLIGKALANNTAKRGFSALHIFDAKGAALIIPEIELRKIAMKVTLGAVLIDALSCRA